MPKNLPATLPARPKKDVPAVRHEVATVSSPSDTPTITTTASPPPALPGMTVRRADLARFMRFGARIAGRGAIPSLRSVRFGHEAIAVTDLDVWLSAKLSGARDVGVLVPAIVLKQCLRASAQPDVRIERFPSAPSSPFKVAIDGAVFSGHDSRDFPDIEAIFRAETPVAQASFGSLEPVLVAASSDETRKNFCAVFFQLCRNLAVATDGHRLHTLEIDSRGDGDFLVPKRAVELVESIRKATRTAQVHIDFLKHQAVFRIDRFEVVSRLETERFPAWEEVLPDRSKYELRASGRALLSALDQVAGAIGDRSRGIRLRRVPEGLEIHGENPDAGTMTTVIEASGWKEGAAIGVNLGYLHDAVRFVARDELTIGVSGEEHPLIIEADTYFACVMPVRLEKGGQNGRC
jgi:DNA polymerase III beta subunit, C-terminal domain